MKKFLSIILIAAMMFNLSCLAFAKWALVSDGYTTFYDSEFAARNAYTYGDFIYEVPYVYGNTYDEIVDSQEEYEFWQEVSDEIKNASRGETVTAYCNEYQNMNVCVMEALSKKNTVSLQIYSDAGDFFIPAGKLLEIEPGRISYPLRQVYLVYNNPTLWNIEEPSQKEEILPIIEPEKVQETPKDSQKNFAEDDKKEQTEVTKEKEIVYIAADTEVNHETVLLKYKILVAALVVVVIVLVILLIKSKSSKRKYMTL